MLSLIYGGNFIT